MLRERISGEDRQINFILNRLHHLEFFTLLPFSESGAYEQMVNLA